MEAQGRDINGWAAVEQTTPGAMLVDVRTPAEFAQGHLPGAANVELAHIEGLPAQVPAKDTPLFLYCRSGRRSGIAAQFMRAQGFTDVVNMGGVLDWDGPLEK